MKTNKFLSASRSEFRALIITISCICAGILLPPFISSVSQDQPIQDVSIIDLSRSMDTLPARVQRTSSIEPFDINSAELEDLVLLEGIGQILGKRIIKFRDKLGGFHSIEQVGETYGLDAQTFDGIRPYLLLETGHKVITISRAGEWQLASHPYISREQATALYQHIKRNGPPSSIEDLTVVGNEDWLQRLEPYLAFGS